MIFNKNRGFSVSIPHILFIEGDMMKKNIISTPTVIWVVLIMITFLSFNLVENVNATRIAISLTVVIAFFKARLIIIYFMELKREVLPHRVIFESWAILALIVVLGGYWCT